MENISIPPSKELDFDLPGFNQPPSLVTLVVDHRIPEKGQKILLWPLFGFSYPDSPFKIPIRPLPPQTGTQGGTFKFLDVLKFHLFLFNASMKHEKTFKLGGFPQT